MPLVDLTNRLDNIFALVVTRGRLVGLPLVVSCAAYAHHLTEVTDSVVSGQQGHYFEIFGFKRTYSRSPSAFV